MAGSVIDLFSIGIGPMRAARMSVSGTGHGHRTPKAVLLGTEKGAEAEIAFTQIGLPPLQDGTGNKLPEPSAARDGPPAAGGTGAKPSGQPAAVGVNGKHRRGRHEPPRAAGRPAGAAEWLDATGHSPAGLDRQGLGEAIAALTGEPSPFQPAPTPPGPSPTPPAADPDVALVVTARGYFVRHHTGANAQMARALATWLAAKGLS